MSKTTHLEPLSFYTTQHKVTFIMKYLSEHHSGFGDLISYSTIFPLENHKAEFNRVGWGIKMSELTKENFVSNSIFKKRTFDGNYSCSVW